MAANPTTGEDGASSGSSTASNSLTVSPTAGAPSSGGVQHVDTAVIDSVAARIGLVGTRLEALAARVQTLSQYTPTAGGVNDRTWTQFVNSGYGNSATRMVEAVSALATTMSTFETKLEDSSRVFAQAEQVNTQTANTLRSAIESQATPASAAPSPTKSEPISLTAMEGSIPAELT